MCPPRTRRLVIAGVLGVFGVGAAACADEPTGHAPPAMFELRVLGALDTVIVGTTTAAFVRAPTAADTAAAPHTAAP